MAIKFTKGEKRELKANEIKLSDAKKYGDENATEYDRKKSFDIPTIIRLPAKIKVKAYNCKYQRLN